MNNKELKNKSNFRDELSFCLKYKYEQLQPSEKDQKKNNIRFKVRHVIEELKNFI